MSQTPDHVASVPEQPAPPVAGQEAENQSPLDIYAAYLPPSGAPPVGVPPHGLKEKPQGEKISVPIVVGAISIIVLLLLIYFICDGLSNDSYLALASFP